MPVEQDSLPLHVIGKEPPETEAEVARFVVRRPALWQLYSPWLATLHPTSFLGVAHMAKGVKQQFDLATLIEYVGREKVLEQLDLLRVLDEGGLERALKAKGVDWLLSKLTPAQRRELQQRLSR